MSIDMIASQKELPRAVDFSKRFIPEFMTPLAYSGVYWKLSEAARLRYNQLYASSFHEQFMSLEIVLVECMLWPLIRRFQGERLEEQLRIFREEEIRHTVMFHDLHVQCEPHLYGDRQFYFLRMPSYLKWVLREVSKRPAMFPFCIWLTIIEEERTIYYSKQYLKSGDDLEPEFVATHRKHLADEVGHVGLDEQLIELLWPAYRTLNRAWNARMFSWVLSEYFNVPKRAGWRVILEMVREFPEYRVLLPEFKKVMRDLEGNSDYLETLYNREMVPKSFALLDQWPEFHTLQRMLPGYEPLAPALS